MRNSYIKIVLITSLLLCLNLGSRLLAQCPGGVIVSEINYSIDQGGTASLNWFGWGGQYFEIANTSTSPVDISGWTIGFRSSTFPATAILSNGWTGYWRPAAGTIIAPGELIVIGGDQSNPDVKTYRNPEVTADIRWNFYFKYGGVGIWDQNGDFVDGVKYGAADEDDDKKLLPPEGSGVGPVDFSKVHDFGPPTGSIAWANGKSLTRALNDCELLFADPQKRSKGSGSYAPSLECQDETHPMCKVNSRILTLDQKQANADAGDPDSASCSYDDAVYSNQSRASTYCSRYALPDNPPYSFLSFAINLQTLEPADCGAYPIISRSVFKDGVKLDADPDVVAEDDQDEDLDPEPAWKLIGGGTYILCFDYLTQSGNETCAKAGSPCFAPFYVIPPCNIDSINLEQVTECFDNGTEIDTDDYVGTSIRIYYRDIPESGNLELFEADGTTALTYTGGGNIALPTNTIDASLPYIVIDNVKITANNLTQTIVAKFTDPDYGCEFTTDLGPFESCSCFVFGCERDTEIQAGPVTGFNDTINHTYVLVDDNDIIVQIGQGDAGANYNFTSVGLSTGYSPNYRVFTINWSNASDLYSSLPGISLPEIVVGDNINFYKELDSSCDCIKVSSSSCRLVINPLPVATPIMDITVCAGTTIDQILSITPPAAGSTTPGTYLFDWIADNTDVGISALTASNVAEDSKVDGTFVSEGGFMTTTGTITAFDVVPLFNADGPNTFESDNIIKGTYAPNTCAGDTITFVVNVASEIQMEQVFSCGDPNQVTINVQGGLPDLIGSGADPTAYYTFEIAEADGTGPTATTTSSYIPLTASAGEIANGGDFLFTGLTPGFKSIRVMDSSTPDECVQEIKVEVYEAFTINGPTDLCDNTGQLVITSVTGGRDPRIYTNAIAPTPQSSGGTPYTLYLFEKGDSLGTSTPLFEVDARTADGTTSIIFPNISPDRPTEYTLVLEDNTPQGCNYYKSMWVQPNYDPTLKEDFVLCLSSDVANPTQDLDLLSLLTGAGALPPNDDKIGRFTGVAGIVNNPDASDFSNSVHTLPGSVLDNLQSTPGTSDITIRYTLGGEFPLTIGLPYCLKSDEVTITLSRPVSPTPVTYTMCEGAPIPSGQGLQSGAAATETEAWYDQDGTTLLIPSQTGNTPFAPPAAETFVPGTYTYYVESIDINGCRSPKTPVQLIISKQPEAPTAPALEMCQDDTPPTITPTSVEGLPAPNNFKIYDNTTGTAIQANYQAFDLNHPDFDSYFDETTAGVYRFEISEVNPLGCESSFSIVEITVHPKPTPVIAATDTDLCAGEMIDLSVNAPTDGAALEYEWYRMAGISPNPASDPGIGTSTTNTLSILATTTATYYVVVTSSQSCVSEPSTTVVINITEAADPIDLSDQTICEGENLLTPLSCDCGTNTAQWYDATSLGTLLNTGDNYTPANVTSLAAGNYEYYVQCADAAGCISNRLTVELTILSVPAAPAVLDQKICLAEEVNNIIPTNPGGSTFTIAGPGGTSVGPANNFTHTQLDGIGLDNSTPGVYNFEIIETNNDGCDSPSGSFSIEVLAVPTPVAGITNTSICLGATTDLSTSSITDGVYEWYEDVAPAGVGAEDIFVSNLQSPTTTPSASTNYYVVVTSSEACRSIASAPVSVVVTPILSPTNLEAGTACQGTAATDVPAANSLRGVCSSGSLLWFTSATGGIPVGTGTEFVPSDVSTLAVGSHTYYAACENTDGCQSDRIAVQFIIQDVPAAPVVANQAVCLNDVITDIIPAGGLGSTFEITGPTGSLTQNVFTNANLAGIGFTNNIAGTYSFTINEITSAGCEGLSGSFTIDVDALPTMIASNSGAVCAGDQITLSSNLTIAGANYTWTDGSNTVVSTDQVFTFAPISSNDGEQYTVAISNTGTCSVQNTTASTTIIVYTAPDADTPENKTICEGGNLLDPLTANCATGTMFWYDAPENGNLLGSGTTFTPTGTASLAQGVYTYYSICRDGNNCESPNALPVTLTIEATPAAPVISNITRCAGEPVPTLTPSGISGSSVFNFTHPDGTVTASAASSLPLVDDTNGYDKDTPGTYVYQIREQTSCEGPATLVTVTVAPRPSAIAGNDGMPICIGGTKSLTADFAGVGASYAWYIDDGDATANISLDLLISNDQNPTVAPTATSGYFVVVTSANGCSSVSNMTTVTVNAATAVPIKVQDEAICEGELLSDPLEVTSALTVNWYDAASGGTLLGVGNTFTPAGTNSMAAGSYTYFAEAIDAEGCISPSREEVALIINPTPSAPTVKDEVICIAGTVPTITPIGESSGSIFKISYPDGTVAASNAASFQIATGSGGFDNTKTGTYTFIVTEVIGTCEGATTSFQITVNDNPVAVAGNDGNAICLGDAKVLTADDAGAGATYNWYLDAATDVLVSTDRNPTVTPTVTSDYYVIVTSANGCTATSNLTKVEVITIPTPTAPIPQTICEGNVLTTALSATTTAAGINWYDAASGGNIIANGTSYTPNSANLLSAGTHSYFAESYDANGCVSSTRLEVVLTVNESPVAPTVNNLESCISEEPTVTPIGSSLASTFKLIYPDGTAVSESSSFTLTNQKEFDNTTPGIYTFLIGEVNGTCIGATSSFTVTVNPTPSAIAGVDASPICAGDAKSLTAIAAGPNATYSWYQDLTNDGQSGDDILVSNDQNPTITPASGDTYYYYSSITGEGCASTASDRVKITVNTVADVTAPIGKEICEGGSLSTPLSVSSSNTVNWYDAASGGTLLGTGLTFTPESTNTLSAGTYSYFAEASDAFGCTSPNRIEVVLTVNGTAGAPEVKDLEICRGSTVPTITPVGSLPSSTFKITYPDGMVVGSDASTFAIVDDNGFDNDLSGTFTFIITEVTGGCLSPTSSFTITVRSNPSAIAAVSDNSICITESATLNAANTGTDAVYNWYQAGGDDDNTDLSDDTFIGSNKNLTITPTTTEKYFYVVTNTHGCTSTSASKTITVNAVSDPTAAVGQSICEGRSLSTALSATSGGTNLNWYDAASGGNLLNTGSTFIPNSTNRLAAGTYSYFAESVDANGCLSANRLEVVLTVNAKPIAPVVEDLYLCVGSTLPTIVPVGENATSIFKLRYPDYTYVGTNESSFDIANIKDFDITTPGIYSFSVAEIGSNGCEGTTHSFDIIVDDVPTITIGSSGSAVCFGEIVSLYPTFERGSTYSWYEDDGDGIANAADDLVSTDRLYRFSAEKNASYYYELTTSLGCQTISDMEDVTTTTVGNPTAPVGQVICAGSALSTGLSATQGTNATGLLWYESETSRTILGSGTSFIPANTDALATGIYTYYVASIVNSCISDRIAVTLVVDDLPQALSFEDIELCINDAAPTITPLPGTNGNKFNIYSGGSIITGQSGNTSFNFSDADFATSFDNTTAGTYTFEIREVSPEGCEGTGANLNIIVGSQIVPVAIALPAVCPGETVTLSTANIPGAIYSWFKNDVVTDVVGVAAVSTFVSSAADNDNTYKVAVTTPSGCQGTSASVTLKVNTPPTAEPTFAYTANTDCSPANLSLDANVLTGSGTYTYLWSGPNGFTSTAEEPVIANAGIDNNGSYTVSITDGNGCEVIASVEVTGILESETKPVIASTGPACVGGEIILSITGYDGASVSYEWSKDGTPISGETGITGELTNSININPVNTSSADKYTVQVIVDGCTLTSDAYDLEVFAQPLAAPSVAATAICHGGTLKLSDSNTDQLTYSWTGPDGFTSNAKNPIISNVSVENNGGYTVVVTNSNGCQDTKTVEVTTILPAVTTPTITGNSPVCVDEDIVLNILQSYTGTTVSYSWSNGAGTNIGSTSSITLAANHANAISPYVVQVTVDGCTSEFSMPMEIVVDPLPTAVATNNGPICAGETVTLLAGEVANASYEWRIKDGDGTIISTDQSPVIFGLATTTTYELTVIAAGCTSDPIATTKVTINDLPSATPMGTYTLKDDCSPSDLTLKASAVGGSSSYTYLWSGPSGFTATAADPVIPEVGIANNGSYTVSVTDANGCSIVASTEVTGILDDKTEPVIASTGPACVGGEIILSIPGYDGASVSYEWSKDGTPIAGETGITGELTNSININPVNTSRAGKYTVQVIVDGCTLTSDAYDLEVFAQPVADPSVAATAICHGGTLNLVESNTDQLTYSWTGPDGFTSNAKNPIISNVSVENNGGYTVVVTNSNGCQDTKTVEVTTILPAVTTPTITGNSPVCVDEDIVLNILQSYTGTTVSYSWSNGAGTNIPGTSSITLAANHANAISPYVVQVTVDGCTSEFSMPMEIVVDPLPTAVATNNGPICAGETVTLLAGEVANASYEWRIKDGDGTIISTDQSPVIFGLATTTTYELTVIAAGCTSDPIATTEVTINNLPSATPMGTYTLKDDCSPSDLTLEANAVGGSGSYTYLWSGPNGFTSTAEKPVIANAGIANNGSYTVSVTDANGCSIVASTEVTGILNDKTEPVIASTGPACVGGEIILSIPGYDGASVSYEWSKDGTPIADETGITGELTNSININPVNTSRAGKYTVQVIVDGCTLTSDAYDLEVFAQPTAAATATATDICDGGTLELEANSVGATSFSWTGPGGFTSNAENPVISNVSVEHNGGYTVIATSSNGCAVSSTIVVDNILPAVIKPTITGNSPVCADEDIVLNILQSYSGTVTYNWSNGAGTNIETASSITIAASNVNAISPYVVQVTVDGCASDFSEPIEIDVDPLPTAVATNNGPVCLGETVTLLAGDVANASYEWRVQGSTAIVSTDQSPEIFGLTTSTTYELTVIAEGCISNPLATTTVTINAQPTANPNSTHTINPDCSPSELKLDAMASGGTAPYEYLWIGPDGYTSTAAAPVIAETGQDDNGSYTVTITDANGCSAVGSTEVSGIRDSEIVPQITGFGSVCIGNRITLSVPQYAGTQSVSYDWTFPGSGDNISGLGTHEITINPILDNNEGDYAVVVTVDGCVLESPLYPVVVHDPPTVIADNDGSECIIPNSDLQLTSVVSGGSGTYTTSWAGPNGFTSTEANPVIPNAINNSSGIYTVMIIDQNGCTATASTTVDVTISPSRPYLLSNSPICVGDQLRITAPSYDGFVVTYNWTGPLGTTASGAYSDGPTIVLDDATSSSTGDYTVRVTIDGCSSELSDILSYTAYEAPTVTLSNDGIGCIARGENVTLTAEAAGGSGVYTYEWSGPNGFSSTDAITEIPNVDDEDSGNYTVVVTDATGCSVTSTTLVDILEKPTRPVITGNSNVCSGSEFNLRAPSYAGNSVIYEWNGPNGMSTLNGDFTNGPLLNVLVSELTYTGEYKVRVTVDGCTSEMSFGHFLTINALPTVIADNTGSECEAAANDISLLAIPNGGAGAGIPTAYTYEWVGPNGFFSTDQNPILPNVASDISGTYTVVITDANGCSGFSSTTVDVTSFPARPIITANAPTCEGGRVTLSVAPASGDDVTYEWTMPSDNSVVGQGSNAITIDPIQTAVHDGTYTLKVTVNGCSVTSAPYELTTLSLPTLNPSYDIVGGCSGSTIQLNANGINGAFYEWRGPKEFISFAPDPFIIDADLENNGTYTVVATSISGCQQIATIAINDIQSSPQTPTITTNGPVCRGDDIILSIFENYNGGTIVYEWVNGAGTSIGTNASTVILSSNDPDAISPYYVQVTVNGCTSELSSAANVIINEEPEFNALSLGDVCEGEDVLLKGSSDAGDETIFIWYLGDPEGTPKGELVASEKEAVISNLPAGDYEFYLKVRLNDCISNTSIKVDVNVEAVSQAFNDSYEFDYRDTIVPLAILDNDVTIGDPLIEIVDSTRFGTVSLNSDGTVNYISDGFYIGTDEFTYSICSEMCPDACSTATVTINITTDGICNDIPNIFTPNGDAMNQEFAIPCLVNYSNSSMTIYNRWGDEIFHSSDYQNDWEGTWKGGDLPVGTYFYICKVNNPEKTVLKGYVYIQR